MVMKTQKTLTHNIVKAKRPLAGAQLPVSGDKPRKEAIMKDKQRIYQVDDGNKMFGSMLVYIQYSLNPDDIAGHQVTVTGETDCLALAHIMLGRAEFPPPKNI